MNRAILYDFYLASTFRNAWNVEFNHRIGAALEAKGLKAYLPHRDTDQKSPPDEIFMQDMRGIDGSRKVLAVAMNESPNWGAEVGYCFAKQIPVVAITTIDHKIPLILNEMVAKVIRLGDLDNFEVDLHFIVDELMS